MLCDYLHKFTLLYLLFNDISVTVFAKVLVYAYLYTSPIKVFVKLRQFHSDIKRIVFDQLFAIGVLGILTILTIRYVYKFQVTTSYFYQLSALSCSLIICFVYIHSMCSVIWNIKVKLKYFSILQQFLLVNLILILIAISYINMSSLINNLKKGFNSNNFWCCYLFLFYF